MAGFVQIIEYRTSRFDEVAALNEEFRTQRAGSTSLERVTATADRDRPNTYLTIAEFPSYDEAMKNSEDPATTEFARRMAELCDGPPTFYNLDVRFAETM